MVGVAQLVEHRVVVPGVVGSSPITHPAVRVRCARREREHSNPGHASPWARPWDGRILGRPDPGTAGSWDGRILGRPDPGTAGSWDGRILGRPDPGTAGSWDGRILGRP